MYRYKPKEIKHIKLKRFLCVAIIIVCASIASILLHSMYLGIEVMPLSKQNSDQTNVNLTKTLEESKANSKEVSDMIEEISQSVVGISKIKGTGNSIFLKDSATQLGLGSGVIITDNGYILTNEHVCGGKYSTCYVTLENGRMYNGTVVWADSEIDLAIVKINVKSLKYVVLGDSESVKVADSVYAIGNPIGFEFQRTVTGGIISAKNRTIKLEEDGKEIYMEDLIQTDATINPGNSGGPLINLNGEVIGINSVKITSAEGIGFAVPINVIKPIVEKLTNNRTVEEGYLGIFGYDKDVIPYIEEDLNLSSGIYVAQVVLDGPSSKAGIKIGDIITKIDNTEVNKMTDLRTYVYQKNPDDIVNLTIIRNNKTYSIQVTLGRKR